MTAGRMRPLARAGLLAAGLAAVALGGRLRAADAGAPAAEGKPAPVTWSLAGAGEGVSTLTTVTRDGQKLDLLIANGGNTLEVRAERPVAPALKGTDWCGDIVRLQCELLLAEYDSKTRRIQRLICVGNVTVELKTVSPMPGDTAGAKITRTDRRGYFAAEVLEFTRTAAEPATGAEADKTDEELGALGLMQGVWRLRGRLPQAADLPEAFAGWIRQLPARATERCLLRSDRLTLLAPEIEFDPVAGQCTAGPDRVTGAFEADPAWAPLNGRGTDRSAAWSPGRRTLFSGQQLKSGLRMIGRRLQPWGPTQLQGPVLVQQEPNHGNAGVAQLQGETVRVEWTDATPIADAATATGWQSYRLLAASSGSSEREVVLRDGDLVIRGGDLEYRPADDIGTLRPLKGRQYVTTEMNAESAAPINPQFPPRMRLQAEGLQFHLKNRNFEALGKRILESLPPEGDALPPKK